MVLHGSALTPLCLSSRSQGLFCESRVPDELVDLAGNVALDAADGFATTHALRCASVKVVVGALVAAAGRRSMRPELIIDGSEGLAGTAGTSSSGRGSTCRRSSTLPARSLRRFRTWDLNRTLRQVVASAT